MSEKKSFALRRFVYSYCVTGSVIKKQLPQKHKCPGNKRALVHSTRFLKHSFNQELHKSAHFLEEHNRSHLESHLGLQSARCSKNLREKTLNHCWGEFLNTRALKDLQYDENSVQARYKAHGFDSSFTTTPRSTHRACREH